MKVTALSFLVQDVAQDQQKTTDEVRQDLSKASGIPVDRLISLESAEVGGKEPKFTFEEMADVATFFDVKIDALFNPRVILRKSSSAPMREMSAGPA